MVKVKYLDDIKLSSGSNGRRP